MSGLRLSTFLLLGAPSLLGAGACRLPSDAKEVAGWSSPRPDRAGPAPVDWSQPVLRTVAGVPEPDATEASEENAAPPARPTLGDDIARKLDLRGAPLSEALHLIAAMAGVNIYLDAGLDQPVDASFPSVTLDDALSVLLRRNSLALVEDPPGIFWVTRSDEDSVVARRFPLRSIAGADLIDNLRALVPGATMVVDTNANFLVVRAPRADLELVAQYLQAADRVKRQVLIEVEVLEVVLNDTFQLGLEHALSDPNFLGETGLSIEQGLGTDDSVFNATLSLNDFSLTSTITALERFGTVNVVSSPRVLAITNTQASIDVIREIPYVETTTEISSGSGTGTVGTTSQQSVAFKEAGIKLKVTPVIQDHGLVQLAVAQEFSEVVDTFLGIPVLDTRRVDNRFVVRGNQAVLLGGLMQNRKREQDDGVPILMHIPLLGRLFRSDVDSQERRELLVMITSRVLDPEEAAALSRLYEQNFQQRVQASGAGSL